MIELVHTQAELEALPDGTIITWLRIPGDGTSAALAFVRVEHDGGTSEERPWTVWISPGGWDPQTPESAGITYPVRVVSYGVALPPEPLAPMPEPPQFATLMSGGTYPRDEALRAAAMVRAGDAVNAQAYVTAESVLELATAFERWLDRPVAEHLKPTALDTCCCTDDARLLVCPSCSIGDHQNCTVRP